MGDKRPLITLTTDFGHKDPFVGQMKGVIKGINPEADIVDITHSITPYNIREAAVTLGLSYRYFPSRTIHIVVVDPGVGSRRRPILVVGENHYFVGPDNGVFTMVYQKEKEYLKVYEITADHYFLEKHSPTFQGRDVFAPVAAWLTKGVQSSNFGEEIEDFVRLPIPEPERPTRRAIEGEVIYIDHFGNAFTNITGEHLNETGTNTRIIFKGKTLKMKNSYSEAEDRELYCLINSHGLLELFVYRGNAARDYQIQIGDRVGVILG